MAKTKFYNLDTDNTLGGNNASDIYIASQKAVKDYVDGKVNAHHLLDFKWSDCIMNDVSWLRADTFSWQDGGVYVAAYNHLVSDLSGTTAATETIGSYTITYYRASDGHIHAFTL